MTHRPSPIDPPHKYGDEETDADAELEVRSRAAEEAAQLVAATLRANRRP